MKYELAKKLKDAGFPQEGKDGDWYFDAHGRADFCDVYNYDKWEIKIPTLSELIEACKNFLPKNEHGVGVTEIDYCVSKIDGRDKWCFGDFGWYDSLEEAVAYFWLENIKK